MSFSGNIYSTLLVIGICTIQLTAQSVDKAVVAAKAYDEGNYSEAVRNWKELYRDGNSDPELLYNIGNAEAMRGNTPEAIYYYEKADRFKPGNNDINAAIQHERNKIEDSVSTIEMFFLVEWVRTFLSILRPGGWAFIAMIFLLIGLLKWLYALGIIKFGKFISKGGILGFVFLGAILLWISLISYRQIYSLDEGILYSSCGLMQGPSIQSPQLRIVNPGEKIKITDRISGWYKVNLLNLDEGWLKSDCIRIIDMRDRK